MTAPVPSFFSRFWLAFVTWFRIVMDGAFAARVSSLGGEGGTELLEAGDPPAPVPAAAPPSVLPGASELASARMLLRLFQREGRFVDFLEQDITTFSDGDVGAAARVVHEGCRRALRSHARISHVRAEPEGTRLTLDAAAAEQVKLLGQVSGKPPYHGVLRHAGWRIDGFSLPVSVGDRDAALLAEPEVELG